MAITLPPSKDWLDLADIIISFFGVIAAASLAYQANKIAKSNLESANQQQKTLTQKISSEDRAIFRSNYKKVVEALGMVFRDGKVMDEAKNLFWQARDEARLELPKEIADYTQQLFDKMWNAYIIYYHDITGDACLPQGKERSDAVEKHSKVIGELIKEQPNTVYSKYMRTLNE